MSAPDRPLDASSQQAEPSETFDNVLCITLNLAEGTLRFEWQRADQQTGLVRGTLKASPVGGRFFRFDAFSFEFGPAGIGSSHRCGIDPTSIHALMRRVRKTTPPVARVRIGVLSPADLGPVPAGKWHLLTMLPPDEGWKYAGRLLIQLGRLLEHRMSSATVDMPAATVLTQNALRLVAGAQFGVEPSPDALQDFAPERSLPTLRIALDLIDCRCTFEWKDPKSGDLRALGTVSGDEDPRKLAWLLSEPDREATMHSSSSKPDAIRQQLADWFGHIKTDIQGIIVQWRKPPVHGTQPVWTAEHVFDPNDAPHEAIEGCIGALAQALQYRNSPLGRLEARMESENNLEWERHAERARRKELKRIEEEQRRQEAIAQRAEERRRRDEAHAAARSAAADSRGKDTAKAAAHEPPPRPATFVPTVPVAVRMPSLTLQDSMPLLTDLSTFMLRERAALWWVSNQSDDLLCLPHCRIEHLEYQTRTALRVLGPMRGRALLSDEVGLGKTIEAGLVTKELLTRGMAQRFLVLTLPSLVDQWAEELDEKFGLSTVTTNSPAAREDPSRFWQDNRGIVASLHTLKQPSQLAIAQQVHWDMLIVDEAHYLRNRTSQAWQAVNALPRQYLLLLTATPVQNSLDELYSLVTLLQPGQLPSPKEFRARHIDPDRPRQPRAPEELRRLLGQVMIRNTRTNAGIDLPPRHAETVLFTPGEAEADFWRTWDASFRTSLGSLSASQSSMWGRLLLQAAGSSPAAWKSALEKYPDRAAAGLWLQQAPLEESWRRKCQLLVPLTRGENGAVIFTQFLETQAALADYLRASKVPVFVVNGSTPAPKRQPIVEEFHRHGGALLLTHSGTEGRNLQFCRTLVNFDLPWNPMEIEQRVGRLHRLGQKHPVGIYNFAQAGTLQEHLLEVLQEKLNLFELVVGETGLVLGERFSGDEFEEEVFRLWQSSDGKIGEAFAGFGNELAAGRTRLQEIKQLDSTLFAEDFES